MVAMSFLSMYVFPYGHMGGEKMVFYGAMADMVRDEQFVEAISDYLFDDDVIHFYERWTSCMTAACLSL